MLPISFLIHQRHQILFSTRLMFCKNKLSQKHHHALHNCRHTFFQSSSFQIHIVSDFLFILIAAISLALVNVFHCLEINVRDKKRPGIHNLADYPCAVTSESLHLTNALPSTSCASTRLPTAATAPGTYIRSWAITVVIMPGSATQAPEWTTQRR